MARPTCPPDITLTPDTFSGNDTTSELTHTSVAGVVVTERRVSAELPQVLKIGTDGGALYYPEIELTRSALVALRTAGTLEIGMTYVITDHIQGRIVAGTKIYTHAVSATQLSLDVDVLTTYDDSLWRGLYDIDLVLAQPPVAAGTSAPLGGLIRLEDRLGNVISYGFDRYEGVETDTIATFDWGNTNWSSNHFDGVAINVSYPDGNFVSGNLGIVNSFLTLTGTVGLSVVYNDMLAGEITVVNCAGGGAIGNNRMQNSRIVLTNCPQADNFSGNSMNTARIIATNSTGLLTVAGNTFNGVADSFTTTPSGANTGASVNIISAIGTVSIRKNVIAGADGVTVDGILEPCGISVLSNAGNCSVLNSSFLYSNAIHRGVGVMNLLAISVEGRSSVRSLVSMVGTASASNSHFGPGIGSGIKFNGAGGTVGATKVSGTTTVIANGSTLSTADIHGDGDLTLGAFTHSNIIRHSTAAKTLTVANTAKADYMGLAAQLV